MDDNYVEVNTRIADFREKYPEGRLRQGNLEFIEFGGKAWVVYTAEAWRTADDPNPAQGTAWEQVPGKTPYTRDSELQNAETSAWGRAIVAALASDTKDGIASREEVNARKAEEAQRQELITQANVKISQAMTEDQLKEVYEELREQGIAQQFNKAVNARKRLLQEMAQTMGATPADGHDVIG